MGSIEELTNIRGDLNEWIYCLTFVCPDRSKGNFVANGNEMESEGKKETQTQGYGVVRGAVTVLGRLPKLCHVQETKLQNPHYFLHIDV